MKKIYINDYITNDELALSIITDFSSNKLIIKGSTGIGGTSSILGIKDKSVIIASPYLGMIEDKEEQCSNDNNYFIYQKSTHRWSDIENCLSTGRQFILNTTPDQILKIIKEKPYLGEKIKKLPLFIDEFHIAAEADYREVLAEFHHLVFNEWENHFTFSTATPVYRYLDIPNSIKDSLETIWIQKKEPAVKEITIYNYDFYTNWVYSELEKGNKVVLFSNDKNIYKRFSRDTTIRTQVLVGIHLEKEVVTFWDNTHEKSINKIELDNDLYILSTKFITGFDIPFDASVGIISNEKCKTDIKYINDIVQSYGRVRKEVINAAIFYSRLDYIETQYDEDVINNFEKKLIYPSPNQITNGRVNHTLVLNEFLPTILRRQTYNSVESLANNLIEYGFSPIIKYMDLDELNSPNVVLCEKIKNLRTRDISKLQSDAEYVFQNINGDNENYNGFNKNLVQIYAAAIIAKMCDNSWLNKKLKKINRFPDMITVLKTFIEANVIKLNEIQNSKSDKDTKWYESVSSLNELDKIMRFRVSNTLINKALKEGAYSEGFAAHNQLFSVFSNAIYLVNTFYEINQVDSGKLDTQTLQSMEIHAKISEVMKEDYLNGVAKESGIDKFKVIGLIEGNDKHINSLMVNRHIKTFFKHSFDKIIRNISFPLTPEQINGIRIKIEKYKNTLNKSNDNSSTIKNKLSFIDYSIDKQKDNHRYYLLGMASLHIAGHMAGFRCSKKSNREYNIATKVTKILRNNYTPYKMVEIDIASANPQIIDKLLGTKIGVYVYDNLMKFHGISRDDAKVLFNKTINNQGLAKKKAVDVYLSAGYSPDDAERLAVMTTSSKIYDLMCEEEEYIIGTYKAVTKVQNAIRIHDALIMLATEHNTNHLPTMIDGTVFKVNYY